MALPILELPTYELTLPLSQKKIKFRPFVVKEQKNLLMAMEAKEPETVNNVVKDILTSCTLTENIDIDKLPILDVEYYFINLRAKSVGEIVESKYKCNNEVDGKVCGNIMETEVDLTKLQITNKEIQPEIQITDKIVVKMKYPEFGVVKDSLKYDNVTELTFNMIASSIDYIYDGEQFYYSSETSQEELIAWVEQLNQQQFSKIEDFYNNLPELKEEVEIICSKCGFHHTIEVEGLENFFG
jgi:hypothetical protein